MSSQWTKVVVEAAVLALLVVIAVTRRTIIGRIAWLLFRLAMFLLACAVFVGGAGFMLDLLICWIFFPKGTTLYIGEIGMGLGTIAGAAFLIYLWNIRRINAAEIAQDDDLR